MSNLCYNWNDNDGAEDHDNGAGFHQQRKGDISESCDSSSREITFASGKDSQDLTLESLEVSVDSRNQDFPRDQSIEMPMIKSRSYLTAPSQEVSYTLSRYLSNSYYMKKPRGIEGQETNSIVQTKSSDNGSSNPEAAVTPCRMYKYERLQQEIDAARTEGMSTGETIVATLQEMGVNVFIISIGSGSLEEVVKEIKRTINIVAKEAQVQGRNFQSCLLFQDREGRLFNLTLAPHAIAAIKQFRFIFESFTTWQAMIALTVVVRSLICTCNSQDIDHLQPTYIALVLGLILSSEMSMSWLTSVMLVRGMPSLAASTITTKVGSDWLRQGALLALIMAGTIQGRYQHVLILIGLSLSLLILLANLGSRAWHFMRLKPLSYKGPLASVVSYILSVATGLVFPYMGYREVGAGGTVALESILSGAIIVAAVFVLTSFTEVKKYVVVGLDTCDQQPLDFAVGCWWSITLLIAVMQARRIKRPDPFANDEDEILVTDDHSPVGFKAPNFPDFEIDPTLAKKGLPSFTLAIESVVGIAVALVFGAGTLYLAITNGFDKLLFPNGLF